MSKVCVRVPNERAMEENVEEEEEEGQGRNERDDESKEMEKEKFEGHWK